MKLVNAVNTTDALDYSLPLNNRREELYAQRLSFDTASKVQIYREVFNKPEASSANAEMKSRKISIKGRMAYLASYIEQDYLLDIAKAKSLLDDLLSQSYNNAGQIKDLEMVQVYQKQLQLLMKATGNDINKSETKNLNMNANLDITREGIDDAINKEFTKLIKDI